MAETDLQYMETKQSVRVGNTVGLIDSLQFLQQVFKRRYISAHFHCTLCSHSMPLQTECISPAAK